MYFICRSRSVTFSSRAFDSCWTNAFRWCYVGFVPRGAHSLILTKMHLGQHDISIYALGPSETDSTQQQNHSTHRGRCHRHLLDLHPSLRALFFPHRTGVCIFIPVSVPCTPPPSRCETLNLPHRRARQSSLRATHLSSVLMRTTT